MYVVAAGGGGSSRGRSRGAATDIPCSRPMRNARGQCGAYPTLAYDPVKDFRPITLMGLSPVARGSPTARRNRLPTCASPNRSRRLELRVPGPPGGHLSAKCSSSERYAHGHVPYRGAGPAAVDLAAGGRFLLRGLPSVVSFLQAARCAAGGDLAETPAGQPNVPTMAEAASSASSSMPGRRSPAGTRRLIGKLHGAFSQAVRDPDIVKTMIDQGAEATPSNTPAEFAAFIAPRPSDSARSCGRRGQGRMTAATAACRVGRANAMNSPVPPAPRAFGHVETWVFDLDNTLYPHHLNLWQQVDERIRDYIAGFLKVTHEAPFRAEGLLQALRHLDARTDDRARHEARRFPRFRAPDRPSPLEPNPALGAAIEQLPGRKLILTNGTRRHADAVLARLGLDRHFQDVFDIIAAELEPKPRPKGTYDRFLKPHDVDAGKAAMFEDLARNLAVPHSLGMTTVLVVPEHTREVSRGLGARRARRPARRPRHRRSGRIPAGDSPDPAMNVANLTPSEFIAALDRAGTRRTTSNGTGDVVWGMGQAIAGAVQAARSWMHWVRNIEALSRIHALIPRLRRVRNPDAALAERIALLQQVSQPSSELKPVCAGAASRWAAARRHVARLAGTPCNAGAGRQRRHGPRRRYGAAAILAAAATTRRTRGPAATSVS